MSDQQSTLDTVFRDPCREFNMNRTLQHGYLLRQEVRITAADLFESSTRQALQTSRLMTMSVWVSDEVVMPLPGGGGDAGILPLIEQHGIWSSRSTFRILSQTRLAYCPSIPPIGAHGQRDT